MNKVLKNIRTAVSILNYVLVFITIVIPSSYAVNIPNTGLTSNQQLPVLNTEEPETSSDDVYSDIPLTDAIISGSPSFEELLIGLGFEENSIKLLQWESLTQGISTVELEDYGGYMGINISRMRRAREVDSSFGKYIKALSSYGSFDFDEGIDLTQFESIQLSVISQEPDLELPVVTLIFEDEDWNALEIKFSYVSDKHTIDMKEIIDEHPEFNWNKIHSITIQLYSDNKDSLNNLDEVVEMPVLLFIPEQGSDYEPIGADALVKSILYYDLTAESPTADAVELARYISENDFDSVVGVIDKEILLGLKRITPQEVADKLISSYQLLLGDGYEDFISSSVDKVFEEILDITQSPIKAGSFLASVYKKLNPDIAQTQILFETMEYFKKLGAGNSYSYQKELNIFNFNLSDPQRCLDTEIVNIEEDGYPEQALNVTYDTQLVRDPGNPMRDYLWMVGNFYEDVNLTNFDDMKLWIKGDKESGFPEQIKLEFYHSMNWYPGRPKTDIYVPISEDANWYQIPLIFDTLALGCYTNGLDWQNIEGLSIVIEGAYFNPQGEFSISNITLEKNYEFEKLQEMIEVELSLWDKGIYLTDAVLEYWIDKNSSTAEKLILLVELMPEIKALYPDIKLEDDGNFVKEDIITKSGSILRQIIADIDEGIDVLISDNGMLKEDAVQYMLESMQEKFQRLVPLKVFLDDFAQNISSPSSIGAGLDMDWDGLNYWDGVLSKEVGGYEDRDVLGDVFSRIYSSRRDELFSLDNLPYGVNVPPCSWGIGVGDTLFEPGVGEYIDYGINNGVPVGTLSGGVIQRSYNGDFNLWELNIGSYMYDSLPANQFSVYVKGDGADNFAQVLNPSEPYGDYAGCLTSWNWNYPLDAASYHALYPNAWTVYNHPDIPVKLALNQFSPLIPGNYTDSALPLGVFAWNMENDSDQEQTVSIMFSWENILGWNKDRFSWGDSEGNYNYVHSDQSGTGVIFTSSVEQVIDEMQGEFALVAGNVPGVEITYNTRFDTHGDGSVLWDDFSDDGMLSSISDNTIANEGENIGAAVCVTVTLKPGEVKEIPFVLAWDLPVMEFGAGDKWYQYYTTVLDDLGISDSPQDGCNAWEIASYALDNYSSWRESISSWQGEIIEDESKPDYYKSMLFNQLYYAALGSAWSDGVFEGELEDPGVYEEPLEHRFSILENLDWQNYAPEDLRFYGSFPLSLLWPELEKNVIKQLVEATALSEYIVPHDLHDPKGSPWKKYNVYTSTKDWKDLAPKLALMVYQAYLLDDQDIDFLRQSWPVVKEALALLKSEDFDKDGDGFPENTGEDSTYDRWSLRGETSYIGFILAAALKASEEMAEILDDDEAKEEYSQWFLDVQKVLEEDLWNGEYYSLSYSILPGSGLGSRNDTIMADILAGQWYANVLGLGDLVARDRIESSLAKIYEFNVSQFMDGGHGAVNGMTIDAEVVEYYEQSQEMWVGVNYTLVSLFLDYDMAEEGLSLLKSLYDVLYQEEGYWFRIPEALRQDGTFRGTTYYRPMSIWSLELIEW
ncbi:MAG: GH116 family glycosyl-hydrolase [Candidatus Saelkia tenebricola]|nr:GH116 family glycosyl-hydrolase [Candidatus Saelkia tenebricola]